MAYTKIDENTLEEDTKSRHNILSLRMEKQALKDSIEKFKARIDVINAILLAAKNNGINVEE